MPANPIDLTVIDDVKLWLQGQGNTFTTNDDPLLARLISAASQAILTYCNRVSFYANAYTEIFDGTGNTDKILVNALPITSGAPTPSLITVQVGATIIPASADRIQGGWVLNQNMITLLGYCFTRGRVNCSIAYTSGFADAKSLPLDVAQACIDLVALKYRRRKSINLVSESLMAGSSTNFSQKDLTDEIKLVLDRYRQMAF